MGLPIVLFLGDVALALWVVWVTHFISIPPLQYITLVWGVATAVIALVPATAAAYRIIQTVITGKTQKQEPISIDRLIIVCAEAIKTSLRHPSISIPAIIVLAMIPPVLAFYAHAERSPPTSSSVLAITRGDDKVIYVADPENGQVLAFLSSALDKPTAVIPIGSHGNQPGRGRPESMIELRRSDKVDMIFVTDTASDAVHVIDVNFNTVNNRSLAVGHAPRALAITPDLKKLFVSNEQPIPNGSITVFDISSDKPEEFRFVSTIGQVKCPEGLSISPDGRRLYVATQCSGGEDPVLAIDTATNAVVGEIRKLAVGTSVTVSRDGRRLYVGRGNFPCARSDPREPGSPFSIVNLDDQQISSFCLRTSVGAIALSRDPKQRYLFVANGNRLTVFDTEKLAGKNLQALLANPSPYLTDIPLEAPVSGIGVADDTSVYAYLPQSRRLFIYGPPRPSSD